MTLQLYWPGRSWVHRAPAAAKLGGLAALGFVVVALPPPPVVPAVFGAVLVVALGGARLPASLLWAQVRPLWPWLALILGAHLLGGGATTGALSGALAVIRLLALVLAATVVTATTRVTELVAVVEWVTRPLSLVGVRPARIGLVIAMTLRFIPLVADQAALIREAHAARGARGFRLPAVTALVVRVLRLAGTLAEALDARGADQAPTPSPRSRRSAGGHRIGVS